MTAEYAVGAGVPQLGNFRAGAVASLTSPAIGAVAGGLTTIAGTALIGLLLPSLPAFRVSARPVTDPPPGGGARAVRSASRRCNAGGGSGRRE